MVRATDQRSDSLGRISKLEGLQIHLSLRNLIACLCDRVEKIADLLADIRFLIAALSEALSFLNELVHRRVEAVDEVIHFLGGNRIRSVLISALQGESSAHKGSRVVDRTGEGGNGIGAELSASELDLILACAHNIVGVKKHTSQIEGRLDPLLFLCADNGLSCLALRTCDGGDENNWQEDQEEDKENNGTQGEG